VPKIAFSDAGLRSLPLPAAGQTDFWDTSFKGGLFGCRVSQGGTKTFVLKHRNRRYTIGQYEVDPMLWTTGSGFLSGTAAVRSSQ
jgi:hypothetical protein